MASVDEVKAAVLGAAAAGLPYVVTLSFDTNGRTMMGVTPAQLAELAHALQPRPSAIGGNTGTGASERMAAILTLDTPQAADDGLVSTSTCDLPHVSRAAVESTGPTKQEGKASGRARWFKT